MGGGRVGWRGARHAARLGGRHRRGRPRGALALGPGPAPPDAGRRRPGPGDPQDALRSRGDRSGGVRGEERRPAGSRARGPVAVHGAHTERRAMSKKTRVAPPVPRRGRWRWAVMGALVVVGAGAGTFWWMSTGPDASGGGPRLVVDRGSGRASRWVR